MSWTRIQTGVQMDSAVLAGDPVKVGWWFRYKECGGDESWMCSSCLTIEPTKTEECPVCHALMDRTGG